VGCPSKEPRLSEVPAHEIGADKADWNWLTYLLLHDPVSSGEAKRKPALYRKTGIGIDTCSKYSDAGILPVPRLPAWHGAVIEDEANGIYRCRGDIFTDIGSSAALLSNKSPLLQQRAAAFLPKISSKWSKLEQYNKSLQSCVGSPCSTLPSVPDPTPRKTIFAGGDACDCHR
jgi:hypothetical protein